VKTHVQSYSFDRATSYYDATRSLPEDMAAALNAALISTANLLGPGRRCLEVGVGSGRIGLNLLASGVDLIGLDLSRGMLNLFRAKEPRAKVLQADAAHLPFGSDAFDAVLMVHVFHVIAGWQDALWEVRRVLRPGGLLLHNWNVRPPASPVDKLRQQFRRSVENQGETVRRPGAENRESVLAWFDAQGWPRRVENIGTVTEHLRPKDFLQSLRDRHWSGTWGLSEPVLMAAVDDLAASLEGQGLDMETPLELVRPLLLDVVSPKG
jgi:ubiquinone/menaquinone biosynthesis C-methylase UbiE